MKPFQMCPVCGGELKEKKVEKLIRGGNHTAALRVITDVCQKCGERLYSEETVRYFEKVRNRLKRQELEGFQPVGQSFVIEDSGFDITYEAGNSRQK